VTSLSLRGAVPAVYFARGAVLGERELLPPGATRLGQGVLKGEFTGEELVDLAVAGGIVEYDLLAAG
jgi:hypothetical protein